MQTPRRSVAFISIAITAILFAGARPAAAAAPVINDHYSGSDAFTIDECGLTIDVAVTFEGHFMAFEVPGSDGQAYLGHDNFNYREVWTNPDSGEWLVLSGHGLFKEMTAEHVEGDIWRFTAQTAGQPFMIQDSDGNVVLRDRGLLTETALFDTLGDGEVGAEFIEGEITGVHGKFPGLEVDFCALVTDLIG
jgi:hypothetical protein